MTRDREARDAACKFFAELWETWVALDEDGAEIDEIVIEEIATKHGLIVAEGDEIGLAELGEAIITIATGETHDH
jgi:hypothetical protein